MKKILFAVVASALFAAPVLACPNHDEAPATKTAEKKPAGDDTKKPAQAADTTKQAPATKQADDKTKPADKVSSR